jgi:iron(III) transport system permease protein
MVLPATSTGALLAFVLSIADFGTPRMIGRDFDVLSTEAFTLFSAELGGNPGMASAVSLVLVLLSMAVVLLQRHVSRRNVYHGTMIARVEPRRLRGWPSALAHAAAWLIVGIGALPAAIVALYSFRLTRGPIFQPGFGLQSYERVLYTIPDVVTNTLTFSFAALVAIMLAGTLIGVVVARRRSVAAAALDGTLMIPYVVPGIVMGIAFIGAFNEPPLAITGTGLVIVLAIFIRRLPYAVRASAAALRQVSPSLEEAATSLGCGPVRTFLKVTLPLIAPGLVAGGLLSFVTAMNELSSSLVLYIGRTMTMPVKIYLSVLDGDYGTAAALSTILVTITAAAVYAALRLSGNEARSLV